MRIKLEPCAFPPTRAHATDAGLDIYSPERYHIPPRGGQTIRTGVHVQLPPGCAGLLVSKSGLNVTRDILTTGLIDEGYSGEIVVRMHNLGAGWVVIEAGQKISQLVIIPVRYEPVEIVDEIEAGERGDAGFGSTGA